MPQAMGGSQMSALLESVPGIASVLRSPVADALVNMIRAGAGVLPFRYEDAEELIQYAVRRGLIHASEGDRVLADARPGRRHAARSGHAERKPSGAKKPAATNRPAKAAARRKPANKAKKASKTTAKKRR